jgi:hypothetical protein
MMISIREVILYSGIACLAGTWFGLSTVRLFSHSDNIIVYVIWLSVLPMFLVGPLLEGSPLFWPAFILAQIVYYFVIVWIVMRFLGKRAVRDGAQN